MKHQDLAEICCKILHKFLSLSILGNSLHSFLCKLIEKLTQYHVYKILSESDFAIKFKSNVVLIKSGRKGTAVSVVSNLTSKDAVIYEGDLPNIYLYSHKNAAVSYCSDHIINVKERLIANDYLANKNDDNKTYNDKITRTLFRDIAFLHNKSNIRTIEKGIKICGKYSFNYYHDMFENLIRLVILQDINGIIPNDIPIIVDEDIVKIPSLNCILHELTKNLNREIEVIRQNELIIVGELWSFTAINQLVPNYKNASLSKDIDYLFDKEYIQKLRNSLLPIRSNREFPQRIFITRKNTNKRNFNEDEIFSVLDSYGFVKIAPEEFCIQDQIQLFYNAQWIVGGSGAALTNLLFCQSDCNVLCLIGRTGHVATCFTTPVHFNAAKIYYYQQGNKNVVGVHSNFNVDVEKFNHYFKTIIKE